MLKTKRKRKNDMTQPMKAGCPKKPAAVEGGRMPNYSEDEDYCVAVAYTNVTVDPIRGVGQKGENFWTRVHDKFCMLQQKELVESGQHIQVQTKDSIKQRWKKRIAKSVQLSNKLYKQLKGKNKVGGMKRNTSRKQATHIRVKLVSSFALRSVCQCCTSCQNLIQR